MQFLKKILMICFVVIMFIFLVGSFFADTFYLDETLDTEVETSKVLVEIETQPRVFKIIKLKEKSEEIIANEIKDVVGMEDVTEFKYSDLVAVEATANEIKELEKDPYVKNIVPQRVFRAVLQESVGVINADISWPLVSKGINLTGIEQGVCVLDSGVNYSHLDLSERYLGGYDFVNSDPDPYDDNGHGTHVAGIIGASGGIMGVAPGVGIVSVKVLDAAGNGNDADIISGIEWCVDNQALYNISVISMSIGSVILYGDYCNDDPLASSINAATAQNISVVVSSGNDKNYTHIGSPACVENSTAVGMSYDKNYGATTWYSGGSPLCTDNIANSSTLVCFGNRNSLIDLIAPGAIINSTTHNGGYGQKQGTSMSAPMVSGAMIILRQYLNSSSQDLTPSNIESILKNNGRNISDNLSNANYTLIDIYSSLLSLDVSNPNVTLVSPRNNVFSSNQTQDFVCNVSDWQLQNLTLKIWNSTNEVYYNTSVNFSGISNSSTITVNNLDYGVYTWNFLSYDNKSNNAFAEGNFTLTITEILSNLSSPLNNTYTNQNDINFSCYSETNEDYNLTNVSFYLWLGNDLSYNETKNISGITNLSVFNYSFSDESNYSWNCLSVNNVSNQSFAVNNFIIVYDITNPNVSLISPSSGSSYTSNSQEITFTYNVTENNLGNCSLIVNGIVNLTNSSLINLNQSQRFTQSFVVGSYSWQINCSDFVSNQANSSSWSFSVVAPVVSSPSGGSGGGGGGGSSPKSYSATSNILGSSEGYTQELKVREKINFELGSSDSGLGGQSQDQIQSQQQSITTNKHTLTINKVYTDKVSITIRSSPITLELSVGEEKKISLTDPNFYNLYVKLNSIKNLKTNITIKEISEQMNIMVRINQTEMNESVDSKETIGQMLSIDLSLVIILIFIVVLVILLIIYFLNQHKISVSEKKLKTNKKKKVKKTKKKK